MLYMLHTTQPLKQLVLLCISVLFHVSSNRNSTETSVHKMVDAISDSMNEMKMLLD